MAKTKSMLRRNFKKFDQKYKKYKYVLLSFHYKFYKKNKRKKILFINYQKLWKTWYNIANFNMRKAIIVKKAYLEWKKKLMTFRKSLIEDIDKKRGKMYFTWLKDKTEKDKNYIYTNVVNYTLPNYVITQYIFNKSNKNIKSIIK